MVKFPFVVVGRLCGERAFVYRGTNPLDGIKCAVRRRYSAVGTNPLPQKPRGFIAVFRKA